MVLINCNILTMDDGIIIRDGYISINGGIISAIGEMAEFKSDDSEIIDMAGRTVLPGFIDAHTHLGMWEDSLGFEGDDGNEDSEPCTPQLRAIDGVNPIDRCFEEAVRAGVTCVLTGPGSANPIAGQISAISTCGRRIDDMLIASPAAMKFALGENPKSTYHSKGQSPVTRMSTAAIIREQLLRAKRYCEDVQRYERSLESEDEECLDRPEFDFKCEAMLPVIKREIKAHFHAHRADDIFTAVRIAREFDLDFVIVHGTGGHAVSDILAENGVKVLCGPIISDRCKPELAALTPEAAGKLNKAGVPVAIITDHPETPVQYLPLCAEIAVKNGLDHNEALKAITIVPAEICGIDHKVGSIKVGKRADIIAFDKGCDPLDIGNPPSVVICGGKRVV